MRDLDGHALALYQALQAEGRGDAPEVARAAGLDGDQAERGWRRLDELGLIERRDGRLEPVEPDVALMRTMDAYHAHVSEQAATATSLRLAAQSLVTVFRPAVTGESARVELEYLRDRRSKDRAMAALDATAQESVESLHPGPMPPMHVLNESLELDAAMVARGIRVRALYPQSVLQTPRYGRYMGDLTERGVEVRIIDHAPFDLLLQDRRTAFLPGSPEEGVNAPIVVVHNASLVRLIAAVYDDYWLRARPFEAASSGAADGENELTPQERVVIRLMAGGLSDEQIARRMGVHRRTVQRAVAKLMRRLQAGSRFEAGLKLAQDAEFVRALRRPGAGAGPPGSPAPPGMSGPAASSGPSASSASSAPAP